MARVEPRRLPVDGLREWVGRAPDRQAALVAAGLTPKVRPSKPNVLRYSLNRKARRKLARVAFTALRKKRGLSEEVVHELQKLPPVR